MPRRKLDWSRRLPASIAVESRTLRTLFDLAELVAALPKARRDNPAWIAVANGLMAAAAGGDVPVVVEWLKFARMVDRAPI